MSDFAAAGLRSRLSAFHHLRHQARLPECPVQSARRAPLDDRDGAEQTSMRHGTLEERAMIEFLAGSVLDWQNQSSIRLLQRDGARGVQ